MVIVRMVDLSATTLSRAFGGGVLHWLTLLKQKEKKHELESDTANTRKRTIMQHANTN